MNCVIQPTVHRINSNLKLLKNHVRVGPKYRRTDVQLGGCNIIHSYNAVYTDPFHLISELIGDLRCKTICFVTIKNTLNYCYKVVLLFQSFVYGS